MKRFAAIFALSFLWPVFGLTAEVPAGFSVAQIISYPFPDSIVGDPGGHAFAYVLDTRGVRTLWFARAPDYVPHMLYSSNGDDGQEITNVAIARDDSYVVYVRGGEHDANWPEPLQPDPDSSPIQPQMQVWSVPTTGGSPKALGEGDVPVISPDGARVAFTSDGAVMIAPIDGSTPAKRMFFDRGQDSDLHWSHDGSMLAFVSGRGDHSFIAIYRNDSRPIEYLAPTTSQDSMPRWSPDDSRIAFIRMHGAGGAPVNPLNWNPQPWQIWVGNVRGGGAYRVWASTDTARGSLSGFAILEWTAGNRLAFVSEQDNWPHLYAISASGGSARLLTPGAYQIEDTSVTPDRRAIVYSANTGSTPGDDDRRHLFRVDVASGNVATLTSGTGSEFGPVALSGGAYVYNHATAQQPPLVTLASGGARRALDTLPAEFPLNQLVTPREVSWRAPDGLLIHGTLFVPREGGRHPAVVFVHGGPPRQMLLTWHYMDYYSNGYAVNQYLVNHGFVVLAVNYRLGIGYGHDFNNPAHWGPTGASEYQDVLSGARWLQRQQNVEANHIGIWGGSYGGYLTALALARNSDVFKAGVDFHGLHDWSLELAKWAGAQTPRYQQYDTKAIMRMAWLSSPDASIAKWRSPVLLIQGDDDRNVSFAQTVDVVERLRNTPVHYSLIVLPNEVHGFLRYASWIRTDTATVRFLEEHLR